VTARAAAAGTISSAITRTVPTARTEATTTIVTIALVARSSRPIRRPAARAPSGSKVRAISGRRRTTSTAATARVTASVSVSCPDVTVRIRPNRNAVRSPV
jgi:hypothetical protein